MFVGMSRAACCAAAAAEMMLLIATLLAATAAYCIMLAALLVATVYCFLFVCMRYGLLLLPIHVAERFATTCYVLSSFLTKY